MTAYRFYTDEEFLNLIQSRIQQSPLIAELARRLENKISEENEPLNKTDVLTAATTMFTGQPVCCPVCEAKLKVNFLENDEETTLVLK